MIIHPAVRMLLAEIEVFRKRTGMSATAFGTQSLNDPKFLTDLQKGRTPSLSTMDKVTAFMAAHADGSSGLPQQEGTAA